LHASGRGDGSADPVVLVWWLRERISLAPLVLFAAGNFIYIAASDLVPEIKHHAEPSLAFYGFTCFADGLLFMLLIAILS
jgi:zinc and cadmium transporter